MRNFPERWADFESPFFTGFGAWRPLLAQLDSLMNDAFQNMPSENRALTPAMELSENEDSYLLSFDMPGVDKEKIDIEVQGRQLMVTAERRRKQSSDQNGGEFMSLRRVVALPDGVDTTTIEAQYQDGVLSIAIPKAAQARKQKIKLGEAKGGFLNKLLSGVKKEGNRDQVKIADNSSKTVN